MAETSHIEVPITSDRRSAELRAVVEPLVTQMVAQVGVALTDIQESLDVEHEPHELAALAATAADLARGALDLHRLANRLPGDPFPR